MCKPDFLAALHELFELDAGAIHDTSVLQNIPGWSSLTFIGLIAMIDEQFGVTVAPNTILKCRTVADLMQAVETELTLAKMAA